MDETTELIESKSKEAFEALLTGTAVESESEVAAELVHEASNGVIIDEKCPDNEGYCHINNLPTELLAQVFVLLDLVDRCKGSEVCRRWHAILTDGSACMDDVVVINLFEMAVWQRHVSGNAGTRIRCNPLSKSEYLPLVLRHVRVANSIKIWFATQEFSEFVLETLNSKNVRMKCLDVYPYGRMYPLEAVFKHLPDLQALTMRPHGTEFFWTGLDLESFPDFPKLDTLLLDSVNLGLDVRLPTSLTTLEWSNRGDGRFEDLRPKLPLLANLQYLLLGHVDFEPAGQLQQFLDTLSFENMPKIQYLVFRFCKFPTKPELLDRFETESGDKKLLNGVKVIKLDLCYGSLKDTVTQFLQVTTDELKILSLNQISEDLDLGELYSLIDPMFARKISLHLGLLQKGTPNKQKLEARGRLAEAPALLQTVLWKFEASFVDDRELLETLLSTGNHSANFVFANELKFVQCPGLTDQMLERIAQCCPRLKKLSVINCDQSGELGIRAFVGAMTNQRTSNCLQILWKRARDHPASFFLTLVNDYRHLLGDLRARFIEKKFGNEVEGQRIIVYERSRKKALFIQDYGESERCRILGFAVPFPDDQSSSSTAFSDDPVPATSQT